MEELLYNYIIDLKKKEINEKQRAKLIMDYMKEHGLSQRSFATKFNFSHSTVADWLLWDKINDDQIETMVLNGYNKTEIYRELRNNKDKSITEIVFDSKFDNDLNKALSFIRKHIKNDKPSSNTIKIINDIRNELNRMEMYLEKR